MTGDRISAAVLAGGRSRRFGETDKALADLDGRPMIRHVAERVAPVADELVVNCRASQRPALADALEDAPLTPRFAVDDVRDQGPVYGLRTALRAAAGRTAVVVACDMPDVDPALLDLLTERARASRARATVVRADGRRQPFPGVYDVDRTRECCDVAVARDDRRLQVVLDRLRTGAVVPTAETGFVSSRAPSNVNTETDLETVATDG